LHSNNQKERKNTFFGTDRVAFTALSNRPRSFDRFSDALQEIIDARVWGGIHFRTADVQAKMLGRNVADYMAQHYFQPLHRPERRGAATRGPLAAAGHH
jgi:hypothetical protein